jgi:glycosyltransferase involved in cell wall biosynthesis
VLAKLIWWWKLPEARKIKILFVYSHLQSFVRSDLEILQKYFDVKKLRITTFKNPLNMFRLLFGMANVHLIYTWFAGTNAFFIVLFSIFLRKKSVVVVGGYEVAYVPEIGYGSLLSPFGRVKVKFVLRNATKLLAVSKSTFKEALHFTQPKRIAVVYNGVDVEKFRPLGDKDKEDLVITVANITELTLKKKGLDTFVKASAYLPDIQFILVGKYNSSVEHLKRIAGSNVTFTGYVSDELLVALYRKAKVYCQLSAHESFGVALAEAMACGCVPVVTRRYALPEVVGDAGFYVPYGDPKAAAEAIKKALKSNKGIEARERINEYFSLKARKRKLIKEILDIF